MTQVEFWEAAGTFGIPGKGEVPQVFAPHAFDRVIGQRVPLRVQPGGQQVSWCTVVAVVVDADGRGATWTVDVEDSQLPGRAAVEAIRRGEVSGFSFRDPESGIVPDPLAAGQLRIRWRDPS